MADSIDLPGRYADPELTPAKHPAELPAHLLSSVTAEINKMQFTDDDITIFLGEYLSEPKAAVYFDAVDKPLTPARFAQAANKRGIRLSRKTQMLYRGKHVFINGESFAVGRADKTVLSELADARRLDKTALQHASADVMEAFHNWYQDGWLT